MNIQCPLSIPFSIYHFCALGGTVGAPPVVTYVAMVADIIYEGRSLVGNLRTIARVGLGIIIHYVGLMI